MKIRKQRFWIIIVIVFVLGGAAGFGISHFAGSVNLSRTEYNELKYMSDKYSKLEAIWNETDRSFYQKVDDKKLETAVYKGLIRGLGDPYSEYLTKQEYQDWLAATTGSYEGVGLTFSRQKNGTMKVESVNHGSPADKAGIKKGDLILRVDGKAYTDQNRLARAIRGDSGTKVNITFQRGSKTFSKELIRKTIQTKTVYSRQRSGNIGYIQITSFEEHTAKEFKDALKQCETRKDQGLIIDLRDNGGGLVDSCVEIADELMGKGIVTYLKDQNGNRKNYRSHAGKTNLPYVLLINGNTASASEILTAAVMDNTNAKVVGQTSYGKGVVQDTRKLKDGSALKLTVMQYFSPKGHVIHKKGIKPDIVVKGRTQQLKQAEELLR